MLIELTMVLVLCCMVLWIMIPADVKYLVMYASALAIVSFIGFNTCVLILHEYNSIVR